MQCKIYQKGNTFENVKDYFRENRDSYYTKIACDQKFHYKMTKNGIVSVSIIKCPILTGKSIIKKVEEVNQDSNAKISYQNMTFDTFKGKKSKKIIDDIISFINSKIFENKNLIIYGTRGAGKTHLAKSIQYETLKNNKKSEFIVLEDLKELFQQTSTNDMIRYEAIQKINRLEDAEFLIIDDLANKHISEFFLNKFQKLLDARRGKLIVTTNLNILALEEFEKFKTNRDMFLNFKYNDRIISRLLQNSIIINLMGEDMRVNGG